MREKYQLAIDHLEELKEKKKIEEKDIEKPKDNKVKILPQYVYPFFKENILIGYYVENIKDNNGIL